jgi:hypothetical protein
MSADPLRLRRDKIENLLQDVQGRYDLLFAAAITSAPACLVGAASVSDEWSIGLMLVGAVVFTWALVLLRGMDHTIQTGRQVLDLEAQSARDARTNEARTKGAADKNDDYYTVFAQDYANAYRSLWRRLVCAERKAWRTVVILMAVGIVVLLGAIGIQLKDVRKAREKEHVGYDMRQCAPVPRPGVARVPKEKRR